MTSSGVKQLVIIPKAQWDDIMESGYAEKLTGLEKTVQIPRTTPSKPPKEVEEGEKREILPPPLPPPPSPSLTPVREGPVKGGEEGGEGKGEGGGGGEGGPCF